MMITKVLFFGNINGLQTPIKSECYCLSNLTNSFVSALLSLTVTSKSVGAVFYAEEL